MSILGDILSTSEGCSVHQKDFMVHVVDILSTSGDIILNNSKSSGCGPLSLQCKGLVQSEQNVGGLMS